MAVLRKLKEQADEDDQAAAAADDGQGRGRGRGRGRGQGRGRGRSRGGCWARTSVQKNLAVDNVWSGTLDLLLVFLHHRK